MNNNELQIIGFDLGHGETSLTITEKQTINEPRLLYLGIRKSVITAVSKLPDGKILIGEDAIKDTRLCFGGKAWLAFKNNRLNEITTREPILLFVREIYNILIDKHLAREPLHFVVGCPSGWSLLVREQYATLLKESGLSSVKIVAESRAAFLEAKDSCQISNHDIEGNVFLIIDIGSSTTDFTLVNKLKEQYVDFGHNSLGGGLIDKAILTYTLEHNKDKEQLKKLFSICPFYQKCVELECRRIKEDFFSKEKDYQDKPLKKVITLIDPDDPEEDISFKIILKPEDIQAIAEIPVVEHLTWMQAFEKELILVKEKIADTLPQFILLTGGASRMGFVLEICTKIFPNAEIKKGTEPEFSIARGLALAGRIDIKIDEFLKEIDHLLGSNWLKELVESSKEELLYKLSKNLVEEIEKDVLFPSFKKWKKSQLVSLIDVENYIKRQTYEYAQSDNTRKLIEETIIGWFNTTLKGKLEEKLNPLCNKYGIHYSSFQMKLNIEAWKAGIDQRNMKGLLTEQVGGNIVEYIGAATALIVGAITGILSGGAGVALIVQGPIGWLIGAVVGAMAGYFGGIEVTKQYIKEADIYSFIRAFISEENFREKVSNNQATFIEGIISSLRQNNVALEELTVNIRNILHISLMQAAKKVSLEIS